jgi:aminoglycoside 3-N-acetyltransferase
MSEQDAVKLTGNPVTIATIVSDLTALGVKPGMTVLLHSSLSRLGWVCGGAEAVVQALQTALGPTGTLVMPTFSTGLSEPSYWERPPVPEAWWETIRETMPAYEPRTTPTRGVGAIPECFRTYPDVQRSAHPQCSFAAWGAHAEALIQDHALDFCFSERSPLARLYAAEGYVLLLGVGHANNTSLHLAESRAGYPAKAAVSNGAPMRVNGQRRWVTFQDWNWFSDDFEAVGADFARETGLVLTGRVGVATAMLMPQAALVDYAVDWMEAHR